MKKDQVEKFNPQEYLLNEYANPHKLSDETLKSICKQVLSGKLPDLGSNSCGFDACELIQDMCKRCQEKYIDSYDAYKKNCSIYCDMASVCQQINPPGYQ